MDTSIDKIVITVKGKDIEVTPVQTGLVQKTATMFFIKDSVTGEWLYAFPARISAMRKKNGNDFSNYRGRETKALERGEMKVEKTLAKQAKLVIREEKKRLKDDAKAKRIA